MITKMKKLTFLVYHKQYNDFLTRLQALGVVHVQPTQTGTVAPGAELEAKMTHTAHVAEVIKRLDALQSKEEAVPAPVATATSTSDAAEQLVTLADELEAQLTAVSQKLRALERDEAALAPWGDFDPERVRGLAELGYTMRFFTCNAKTFKAEWEEEYGAVEVAREKSNLYFVTVTPMGVTPELQAEPVTLPAESLSTVRLQLAEAQAEEQQLLTRRLELAQNHLADLRALESHLRSSIAFDKVVLGTERAVDDKLMVLEGWIPAAKEDEVRTALNDESVYYEIREARPGDNVPILLRNNALTRLYEVLTKMYGMPDYEEFDPTPIVAPFFSLFFAFCLGDAGYGLVLILLGFLLKKKLGPSMRGMMNLVITLGCVTTVVGALLGGFFGMSILDLGLPEWLKPYLITGKIDGTGYDKQMVVALLIGVVHILVAMTVKAICSTVRYGFMNSLSAWGWLLLVVGFVATGGLSFFELISADLTFWGFVGIGSVAAIGIFLLNDLHRNPLINIGAGLWDTYNMATGLLGDLLSYIRLYALCLAGGMLAGVFNMMGLMLRDGVAGAVDPDSALAGLVAVVAWILCGLVIVAGHSLNIALSCISSFVHPLRLTFVEYFKNVGYEGSGQSYDPFSLKKEQ